MRKLLSSAAVALALTTAPLAQAAGPVRASAPISGESSLAGGEGGGLIIALIIAAATIFTIIQVTDDDDDDRPASA
jgi:hypothetical protein